MIDHLVMFSLPPGSGPTALERLTAEVDRLFTESSYVDSAALRFDLGLRSESAARAELLAEIRFTGEDAFRDYLASDAHQTFAKDVLQRMNITIMSIQCHRPNQGPDPSAQPSRR